MLQGKIVVITGASGGLGTHVTTAFLDAGAQVIGASHGTSGDQAAHPNLRSVPLNLASVDDARGLVDRVTNEFGRVDALVHLVGGFSGGQTVEDTSDELLERMLGMNLRGFFYMARAVLPVMRKQGAGAVLAIGSRTAVEPAATLGAYSASKAALVSLVRTIALENKQHGISANVLLPGTMDTPANRAAMPAVDFSKWVNPAQVAALLVHLATTNASQVTGAVIPVYGGEL